MVASLVTTLAATIAVGEDEFLEVGAQLELHGSILHDHTQRLDALPPTLFEGYDRDLRELYTRSREIRDEIFSQRYRLRSLEYERAIVTFGAIWRPVLALESWAGYVDARGQRYGELDMMIKVADWIISGHPTEKLEIKGYKEQLRLWIQWKGPTISFDYDLGTSEKSRSRT
ncbi:hypothetical protein Tco_0763174 [Tanacetum coccineum]